MSSDRSSGTVADVAEFENRLRIPLSAAQRAQRRGVYPYWGANGPFDTVDDFLFDGARVLVAEDGNTVVRPDGRGTVHWATGRYWVNNHAHVLNVKPDHDLRWLFYALSAARVRGFVSGSAQPKLSMGSLMQLPLHVPPPIEQRRMSWILGTLDDKIDSNRRLAGLLEETAAALFRSRFLDFVGVEEFEESEIGPIPRGWRAQRFSDAVEINPAVPLRKGEVAPFIRMAAVAPWALRPSEIAERPYVGGARFEPGDTLMARITPCIENGKGVFVDFVDQPASGSTEFLVFRARSPLTAEAVFFLSRDDRVRSHAIANMTGSSGRQRVVTRCFNDLKVGVPPDVDSWREDAEFLRAALARTRSLWRESRVLADIRDALLPGLLSGEIRVPDTNEETEGIESASALIAATP